MLHFYGFKTVIFVKLSQLKTDLYLYQVLCQGTQPKLSLFHYGDWKLFSLAMTLILPKDKQLKKKPP